MTGRSTADIRRIALAGLRRGFVDPEKIWDLAFDCGLGGSASAQEMLRTVLRDEQIEELADLTEAQNPTRIAASSAKEEPHSTRLVDTTEIAATLPRVAVSSDRPITLDGRPVTGATGLDRYELGDLLGIGGFAKVLTARDREIG